MKYHENDLINLISCQRHRINSKLCVVSFGQVWISPCHMARPNSRHNSQLTNVSVNQCPVQCLPRYLNYVPYSTLRAKSLHHLSQCLRFQTAIHLRMQHSRLNMRFSTCFVFPAYHHALNLLVYVPFIGEWQFSRYGRDISLIDFNDLFSSFQSLPLHLFIHCFAPLGFSES
jgi:hypothetical protein